MPKIVLTTPRLKSIFFKCLAIYYAQRTKLTLKISNWNFAGIYRMMLSDKKYGLTVNLIATHVMPSLVPHTVNSLLNLETFTLLLEVLQEMLDVIDR